MKVKHNLRKTRVLVTGGAGFIGSHCVEALLSAGLKVRVLDNLSTGEKQRLDCDNPNLEFIQGDVVDRATLKKALVDVTHIVHLAAQVSVISSVQSPFESFKNNAFAFVGLLSEVKETNPKARIVYASSAAVYGDNAQLPCGEKAAKNSKLLSPYALDKAHNEDHALLYSKLYNINALGLRFFNVYGPNQNPHSPYSGVITKFVSAALNKDVLSVYGDGTQTRDFIFVEDVAAAIYRALFSNYQGVLNVATGSSVSLKELVIHMEKILGKKLSLLFKEARKGDIKHSIADIAKAKEEIQFSATTTIRDGLQRLITWLAQNDMSNTGYAIDDQDN